MREHDQGDRNKSGFIGGGSGDGQYGLSKDRIVDQIANQTGFVVIGPNGKFWTDLEDEQQVTQLIREALPAQALENTAQD